MSLCDLLFSFMNQVFCRKCSCCRAAKLQKKHLSACLRLLFFLLVSQCSIMYVPPCITMDGVWRVLNRSVVTWACLHVINLHATTEGFIVSGRMLLLLSFFIKIYVLFIFFYSFIIIIIVSFFFFLLFVFWERCF